jgi:hypothetical protein
MELSEPTGMALLVIRGLNLLGKPFGINAVPRAFSNPATRAATERSDAFDNIYTLQGWSSAESRSGVGSEVQRALGYRHRLECCLAELGVRTLFDAPCGDLNWIGPLASDQRWEYMGGDISAKLVSDLRSRFANLAVMTFDICRDVFPQADLWHCRDCLFHLPLRDIRAAFESFAQSSIDYALLTTHRTRLIHKNLDVPVGGFRYLDLERPPFSLPRPIRYLRDYRLGLDFPRFVGLWRREQIAQVLDTWPKDS